jgi:hypothetical protein
MNAGNWQLVTDEVQHLRTITDPFGGIYGRYTSIERIKKEKPKVVDM